MHCVYRFQFACAALLARGAGAVGAGAGCPALAAGNHCWIGTSCAGCHGNPQMQKEFRKMHTWTPAAALRAPGRGPIARGGAPAPPASAFLHVADGGAAVAAVDAAHPTPESARTCKVYPYTVLSWSWCPRSELARGEGTIITVGDDDESYSFSARDTISSKTCWAGQRAFRFVFGRLAGYFFEWIVRRESWKFVVLMFGLIVIVVVGCVIVSRVNAPLPAAKTGGESDQSSSSCQLGFGVWVDTEKFDSMFGKLLLVVMGVFGFNLIISLKLVKSYMPLGTQFNFCCVDIVGGSLKFGDIAHFTIGKFFLLVRYILTNYTVPKSAHPDVNAMSGSFALFAWGELFLISAGIVWTLIHGMIGADNTIDTPEAAAGHFLGYFLDGVFKTLGQYMIINIYSNGFCSSEKTKPLVAPALDMAKRLSDMTSTKWGNIAVLLISVFGHLAVDLLQTGLSIGATDGSKWIAKKQCIQNCTKSEGVDKPRCIESFHCGLPVPLARVCLRMENWFTEGVALGYFHALHERLSESVDGVFVDSSSVISDSIVSDSIDNLKFNIEWVKEALCRLAKRSADSNELLDATKGMKCCKYSGAVPDAQAVPDAE